MAKKYIDAEKLITEILKLRSESCISESDDYYEYAKSEIIDIIDNLRQDLSEVDLEKEVISYFEGLWPGMETAEQCNTKMSFTPVAVMKLIKHFCELGRHTGKTIWHNVAEETPTKYGEEVLVACRNKNKEDGIWLYDLIQCWEGKWEPRVNWETPVKWAYVKDLDNARKEK